MAFAETTHDVVMLTVAVVMLVSELAVVTLFANKLLIREVVVVGVVMSWALDVIADDCVDVTCWFVDKTCCKSEGV